MHFLISTIHELGQLILWKKHGNRDSFVKWMSTNLILQKYTSLGAELEKMHFWSCIRKNVDYFIIKT